MSLCSLCGDPVAGSSKGTGEAVHTHCLDAVRERSKAPTTNAPPRLVTAVPPPPEFPKPKRGG